MTTLKIHNAETGEVIEREMTPEELQQMQADHQRQIEINAEIEAQKAAKAALLAQLGITEEQAKLLLS